MAAARHGHRPGLAGLRPFCHGAGPARPAAHHPRRRGEGWARRRPAGMGQPASLRRALDHGVRVVVAHCATLGEDRDEDSRHGGKVASFDLLPG